MTPLIVIARSGSGCEAQNAEQYQKSKIKSQNYNSKSKNLPHSAL
jgi:hypothetical protein